MLTIINNEQEEEHPIINSMLKFLLEDVYLHLILKVSRTKLSFETKIILSERHL